FARALGIEHAVAVNSATSGLHLVLRASRIGAGDEVIVPPYTFAATAHAVLHAGGVPEFCDIDSNTLCIAPEKVEGHINARTRAIITVHIGGKPADMDALSEIARRHGLMLIEDAAQAHGATYKGRPIGALGDAGVFSFGTKLMSSFAGGIIVTRS